MEQYVGTESYFGDNSTNEGQNEAPVTTDVTELAKSYLTYKIDE